MFNSLRAALSRFLEQPLKVAIVASVIALLGLLFEGSLYDLWKLKQEKTSLGQRLMDLKTANGDLKFRIEEAKTSDQFIARQAREKLDLVKKDELVFLFEDEPSATP